MTLDSAVACEKLHSKIQQEFRILAEYKMLRSEVMRGIYVIPSSESSFIWFGVIFVRNGIYKDGIFRFNISLPETFPDGKILPTVIFQTDVFHPFVCPYTGVLNMTEAFPEWNSSEHHIWQLLKYIQFIFFHPNVCLNSTMPNLKNKESVDLLSQNKAEFITKVKECIRLSREKIFDLPLKDDKHNIIFEKFDSDVHGPILESIKSKSDLSLSPPISGLSWVQKGEFKALAKE